MLTIKRLSTGYWLVRFNQNQFVQWPVGHITERPRHYSVSPLKTKKTPLLVRRN